MEQLRSKLIKIFANAFCLYLKTHLYHFNITGRNFPQLHKMFDDQYKEIWESVDKTGEIIRTVQVMVPASLDDIKEYSEIVINSQVLGEDKMLEDLIIGHNIMISCLKDAFPYAEHCNEQGIANHIAERMDQHQKYLWMLQSTAQSMEQKAQIQDEEILNVLKNAGLINTQQYY